MTNKNNILITNARMLRKNATKAEAVLWKHIKSKQLNGIKFRRQEPISNYIVDFIAYEKRIIIELDGGQHNQEKFIENDRLRTKYLNSLGFKVIRYWNNDIMNNIDGVLTDILTKIEDSPHPNLPPKGEGINNTE